MRLLRCVAGAVLAIGAASGAWSAPAGNALWIATAQTIATQATAYAQVEPKAVARLRAAEAGVLESFTARPGDLVAAGAVLGHLSGPSVAAVLTARKADLSAAKAAFTAGQQTLAIERQNRAARLSTRDAVSKAEAAVAEAQARLATAHAQESAAESMAVLRAPRAGQVLTVSAADGERVTDGETLLTLQPTGDLWLHAAVYGAEAGAVRVGMPGEFSPADGGAAIPVKVRAATAALQPDGGLTVDLDAAGAPPPWRNGEAGTVTIATGTLKGAAVPTRALILDKAQWWVLVHAAAGDKPQRVTPGPSHGALTFIEKGLAPGAAVVVENAYLEFHRGIAQSYQPPD
ncbi:MAG: efflux RND transporter periplasmic adaptor subunit [Stellaceae bacterium]